MIKVHLVLLELQLKVEWSTVSGNRSTTTFLRHSFYISLVET